MARHFLGLDEEIQLNNRGKHARDLPAVKQLKELDALLFHLKEYPTVVFGVEEVRLFDAANQEVVHLRFRRRFHYSEEMELQAIKSNHKNRMKIIYALMESPNITTVSFIPGSWDHLEYGGLMLKDYWREELSVFCKLLHSNQFIQNLHIATELYDGDGLEIKMLLESSLLELSLPDLRDEGWIELAKGLAKNQCLQVLTLRWDPDGMESLLEGSLPENVFDDVSWTTCNQTLETLVMSCPKDRSFGSHARSVASLLHRVSCVSTIVIECWAPDHANLTTLASCIRKSLTESKNVESLHLHIPLHGKAVQEVLKPLIPGLDGVQPNTTLTSLVLVSDRWDKFDLQAVAEMLRSNTTLRGIGIINVNPEQKVSIWKFLRWIGKQEIVDFLGCLRENSTLRALSFCGWGIVDGQKVLTAVLNLLRQQPCLDIDLAGTGLATKNMLEPVLSQIHKNQSTVKHGSSRVVQNPRPSTESTSSQKPDANGSVFTVDVNTASSSRATSNSGSRLFTQESVNDGHHQEDEDPGSPTSTTSKSADSLTKNMHMPLFFSRFTYSELDKATQSFSTSLGEGGFGMVYKGTLEDGTKRTKVAVKRLRMANMSPKDCERIAKSFKTEVETLGLYHHVNLVRLLGYCIDNEHHMLVYEFMPNSSLDRWLFCDDPERLLDWPTRKRIAIGIARGLDYLHTGCSQSVVHLDVKPQNILLGSNKEPKLADFGIAKLVDIDRNLADLSMAQGTHYYMAPEICTFFSVSAKTDVFSFGILLMEIVRGKRNVNPHQDDESKRFFPTWVKEKIQVREFQEVVDEINTSIILIPHFQFAEAEHLMHIAILCTHNEMRERPDMNTVLHMLEGRVELPEIPYVNKRGKHIRTQSVQSSFN